MSNKQNDEWLEIRSEYGAPFCEAHGGLNDLEVVVICCQPCCAYCEEPVAFHNDETDELDHLNQQQQDWWHHLDTQGEEYIEEVTND